MPHLPLSARTITRHPLVRRTLTVQAVHQLSPTLRRITLVGTDLAGFIAPGPDDHIKMFFPVTDRAVDGVGAGTGADASAGAVATAPFGETAARDFTPRAYRPGVGESATGSNSAAELDIDFVLHGDSAPATRWATHAVVGDTIGIGGPRGSKLAPAGLRSALLLADATALPAIARWLECLPAAVPVTVVIAGGAAESIPAVSNDLLAYLGNSSQRPATTMSVVANHALLGTVRAQVIDEGTFVWAAGEAGLLIPVRRHLRSERGLARTQVDVSGYWKRGIDNLDHHEPLDPADPES